MRRVILFGLCAAVVVAMACDRPTDLPGPTVPAAGGPALASAAAADVLPYSAVRAPEWDALFDRSSGWTGADGVHTIPRSGDERPGAADATSTFWWFGDTFIGEVDAEGRRLAGTKLINNTVGRLDGGQPLAEQMHFFWRTNAAGEPEAQVRPNTDPSHWFWFGDGIVLNGKLYSFALRMKKAGTGGAFDFAVDGVSLLSGDASSPVPFETYSQRAAPLFVAFPETYFVSAVMPNTAAAGAPYPDGYVYLYGTRNDPYNKKLVVARFLPQDVENFSAYRYWDGRRWVRQIAKAAPLTDRLSSEFSVTPLADGRYLLVFQLDALGRDVAVRYGASPVGPWGSPIPIWRAPEPDLDPDIYTYGGKAHPHLSQPGELLISYHVNTFDFWDHFANADIYRPRFIRLRVD
jgi:hypothetical protein